ncbi:MAG: Queuine tRNA-ribosyltransferase [candidate division BRC1 bacterium ADurb.BinA364]|nr:MAG: Queuine tRNA-ribosyltransferase [candidate division BRC1 bacterium ADurb.BinA364]
MILGNTFHLEMRPGSELIRRLGALRRFMGWDGAILTDSGGFQVFSLDSLRKIAEEGVEFRSPIDGAAHFFTPERATAIQRDLGSDIVMAFDECIPYPADRDYALRSTERTLRWLERCAAEPLGEGQLLFGIVQGGMHADLRCFSAERTAALGLPGHAVGGLSVGEPKPVMLEMLESAVGALPADKPVYAMGVGTIEDFVHFIDRGVDMFDCVQPTRHARNGQLFTRRGVLAVKNARFREDPDPPDPQCPCPLCRRFSMAYIRHLFVAKEILAMRLMTWHNLQYFHDFMRDCREALRQGRWESFRGETLAKLESSGDSGL